MRSMKESQKSLGSMSDPMSDIQAQHDIGLISGSSKPEVQVYQLLQDEKVNYALLYLEKVSADII